VLIGLTLAVNADFKILFVVVVFHRKHRRDDGVLRARAAAC
jgi:hypothetical protein